MDDEFSELHPSLRESFVSLPPDPETPLTQEQLNAVFPNPSAWREMMEIMMSKYNLTHDDIDLDQPA